MSSGFLIYAGNEPKSMPARDLGDCRDNYKKLAERVSHSYSCLKNQTSVSEKVDYPRKDNSNYPYSFFSNLLPLLISAIRKLNKINILFENRRVFGVLLCGKIKNLGI